LYGVYYIFLPLPLGQSQRGSLLIQWFFFLLLFFALVRRQQKRETEKDKKHNKMCVWVCVEDPVSSENAKKKMTW